MSTRATSSQELGEIAESRQALGPCRSWLSRTCPSFETQRTLMIGGLGSMYARSAFAERFCCAAHTHSAAMRQFLCESALRSLSRATQVLYHCEKQKTFMDEVY